MKYTLFIITLLATAFLPVKAQKGLHVNEIFDGDIVSRTYMVENIVKANS